MTTNSQKIPIKLELDNIPKLEGKQSDGAVYEQNNLRYDCQGLLLLNEHNGTKLITQQIAKIIFKVKTGITKSEAEVKFTNITASGIVKQNGGPGDIKVAGATIKVSKTETAKITKENITNNKTSKITTSKSNESKLPHTGAENFVFIGAILVFSTIIFYSRYRKLFYF